MDARSGDKLWDVTEAVRGARATPTWWTHDGKGYVIAANGEGRITCIEARTGKTAWSYDKAGNNAQSVVVSGDMLIAKSRILQAPAGGRKSGPLRKLLVSRGWKAPGSI